MAEKIYRPIPKLGTGQGRFQIGIRSKIFQGPDHLLIVQSTGYTEEYKRVFYRDIRWVDIRPSRLQLWVALAVGILFLFFAVFPYLAGAPIEFAIIFGVPFIVWFLINLFLGKTCDCYVGTNVQTLKLPVPRRVGKVSPLIEFLRAQTAAFAPAGAEPPVS